ncbi:MAG: hypothetical protein SGARI_007566 [Bacillariaceae sp.]
MTFEAGKFLDTVGFVSFPRADKNTPSMFQNVFLEPNRKGLFEDTLGYASFEAGETQNGKALSHYIDDTRVKLGLEEEIGCAPQTYFVERHIEDEDSLWKLFRDEVIPKVFGSRKTEEQMQKDLPMAMLLSKGTWRYAIFDTTTLITDDIAVVAPFNDTIIYMGSFSASVILQINETINSRESKYGTWRPMLPDYILVGDVINDAGNSKTMYHLYSDDFDAKAIENVLNEILPNQPVSIKETEYRSTMLWIAFVKEFWQCDGVLGRLPDWFPTPHHMAQHSSKEGSSWRVVSLLLASIVSVLAMFSIYSFCKKQCTYDAVVPEEARAFDGKDRALDDDENDDVEEHEIS